MYLQVTADYGRTAISEDAANGRLIVQPTNYAAFAVAVDTQILVSAHVEVTIFGNINVNVEQSGRVIAHGGMINALFGALVTAERGSTITAQAGSTVIAYDGSSTVAHPGSDVTAYCGSLVIKHDGANVLAYAGSVVRGVARHYQAFLNPGLTNHLAGR